MVTLEDRLRVRSKPGVETDSRLLEPLLPIGTKLFVVDGPIARSGYEWYQVLPIAPRQRTLPIGWVARSSREGAPWLRPSNVECPSLPATMATLAAVDTGTALACFRGREIAVRARLVGCNCEAEGPMEPAWFGFAVWSAGFLLTRPEQTRPPADVRDWFFLHLDPQGKYTRPLPVGELVSVRGLFDHPDASRCMSVDGDARAVPDCRWIFAVTRLER